MKSLKSLSHLLSKYHKPRATPTSLLFNRPYLTKTSYNNLNFVLNQTNKFRTNILKDTSFYKKMSQPNINYFGHSFIDRSSDKRKDAEWIERQLRRDNTVFVLFHVDKPFVAMHPSKKSFSLHKFSYDQVSSLLATPNAKRSDGLIFLGIERELNKNFEPTQSGTPYDTIFSPYSHPDINTKTENEDSFKSWFALDTSVFNSNLEQVNAMFAQYGEFFEGGFLRMMSIQDSLESSIIAQARSVLCWVDRNKFCSTCGHPNVLQDAGSKLACENKDCKSKDRAMNKHVPSNIHYPRVDPVAIMLVVNPARTHVLLGRKKQFPPNMFSCLAGYVEAGESIEEAVRRETFEESGIYTDKIVYHSSQPWPFPSTLMLGCLAYATSTDIKVDTNEIEDARWFDLNEIELILKNEHPDKITVPNERTIAHQLISYHCRNKAKL